MTELAISLEKVCYLIALTRELQVKVPMEEDEDASNPIDDDETAVIEDRADDPVDDELEAYMADLNTDEWDDLLRLIWIGRADYAIEDWGDMLSDARALPDAQKQAYLVETPMVADYLAEGLAAFGLSCDGDDIT
ncbi:DUF3775 domain-containing protein [Marinivivus vitaminiproducens]|uniref:DUF3775 domain-containing protein n=1 Tax=Marinivivus vitaminiproducens TaxID=3035935 RepID=UPI0027A7001C|nr:DUF3775 domain-containing protein [Geminicoccaceae bacterium SCSIO 64248]